jgi:hypothetical protein
MVPATYSLVGMTKLTLCQVDFESDLFCLWGDNLESKEKYLILIFSLFLLPVLVEVF